MARKRRIVSAEASARMSAAARRNRGRDIHSPKRDRSLDARIEMVVRMAQENERDHTVDVIHDGKLRFHSRRGLACRRVG